LETVDAGSWSFVANEEDITEGGQLPVSIKGRRLLICRSDGRLFAIGSQCSHDQEDLGGGTIRKCTIVCPHHGARFNLETGEPYGPPAFGPIRTYRLKTEDSKISVALD
jgi:3-phenylpropionate/trans-cinnamate dioxygenase ferredoxin component